MFTSTISTGAWAIVWGLTCPGPWHSLAYANLRWMTGGKALNFKSGPRPQGRYRVRHRAPPDRLFTLPEMAEMLGMHRQTLWNRLRTHDPTIPPAFQPGGPGTAWKFSERSYLQWLSEQGQMEQEG